MEKNKAIQLLERLQDPEPYEPKLTKDAYDSIQMAIDALKKQIPMKPIVTLPNWEKGIPFSVDCPTCGNYLTTKVKRCEGCGQLIDWSDYETDT